MGRAKRTSWVADFETTVTADDCRVWSWGLADIETAETVWDVEQGTDIHGFIARVRKLHSVIYFHNLKFDGFFLIDYLFRVLRFEHVDKNPRPGQFSTLISNMGMFYSITINWGGDKRTEFRDSYKKLPYKLSVVAKAFDLQEAKGTIDYEKPRPVGYVPTSAEREYQALDVLIIAKALKMEFEQGMTKLTVGADSLDDFKTMMGKEVFAKLYPVLPKSMDDEIRKAYRGGFTYADSRWAGKITRSGRTYDVNSLYPSVMYDRLLPYGKPVWRDGYPETTPERPLAVMSITFTAKLKKNHIPCIQVKGSGAFLATEYQRNITEPVTMSCTNIDLALWEDHYDLDILSFNGGWLFYANTGVFKDYIDKWMNIKMHATGGLRELAKLHLNSLYGKFATNPDVTGKVPYFEDDIVKLTQGPSEERDPIFTAMGVFITAYARDVTIRAAQDNYATFAYADTDSLHLLTDTDPDGLNIHPQNLGAWKFEYAFQRALFIRAKTYVEHVGPDHCKRSTPGSKAFDSTHDCVPGCDYETHVAGLPTDISERTTIEDFTSGRKFDGKLQPDRVPGGVILRKVTFTLPTF